MNIMDELYPLHVHTHKDMNVYMYYIYCMWGLGLAVCFTFVCINEPRRYKKDTLPITV